MTPTKLLLVDDLEENLLALSALLRRDDLELLQAQSATDALELLLIHEVALALIDVQMPEMDGFELAELMRGSERTRRVPIIFVTAGARDAGHLFQGYDAGAVDFLFKPIEPRILMHKVEVFVQLHRQHLELEVREAEARRLQEELAETLRLNETFAAAIGHDLRNPLNAVLMTSELLLQQIDNPPTRKLVDGVRAAATRMARMIDELFDLARIRADGGLQHISRQCVDLAVIVERVVAELDPGGAKDIRRRALGDTQGTWDEGRVQQVVSNLLGNALRHGARDDSVEVIVDGRTAHEVRLSVANRGAIPPNVIPELFKPYRSGGGRGREGLGLGLYIVDHIVRAHGGRIELETTTDRTTFRVTFPRP